MWLYYCSIFASSKVTWVSVGVHARGVLLLLLTNTLLDMMPKHRSSCQEGNLRINTKWIRVDLMQITDGKWNSRFSAAPWCSTGGSWRGRGTPGTVPSSKRAPDQQRMRARSPSASSSSAAESWTHLHDERKLIIGVNLSCTSLNGSGREGSHMKEQSPWSLLREIWTLMHAAVGLYTLLAFSTRGFPPQARSSTSKKKTKTSYVISLLVERIKWEVFGWERLQLQRGERRVIVRSISEVA